MCSRQVYKVYQASVASEAGEACIADVDVAGFAGVAGVLFIFSYRPAVTMVAIKKDCYVNVHYVTILQRPVL